MGWPRFDEFSKAEYAKVEETGKALATARFELGTRITEAETQALVHDVRWGADSWPLHKLGRHWTLTHGALGPVGLLYPTKHAAALSWMTYIALWSHLQLLGRLEHERKTGGTQ